MTFDYTMLALIWRPAAPLLYISAGAIALAALAVLVYARNITVRPALNIVLLLMRLAIIASLAILLMGPSEMPQRVEQKIRPKLSILLDTSQSMLTTDCGEGSRLGFALRNWLSDSQMTSLSNDFDVDLAAFDKQLKPLSQSALKLNESAIATGATTHLAESITQALLKLQGNSQGQAILVISDGHDSEDAPIQSAAVLAKSKNIPVHTVCLGGSTLQRDLALLAVPMQDYMLAGEAGEIMIKVYQVGLDRSSTSVDVVCTGIGGGERQTIPINFNGRRMVEIRIPIKQEQPGQYEYRVHVNPLEGEIEKNNNEQSVFCDVTRARMKVLVLEGQPYWDTKFLAQSLRKDERIEMTQVTQLSAMKQETIATRTEDQQSRVPATADEFAKYDVVILGKRMEHVLNAQTATLLRDYVGRQGGHVIFARGPAFDVQANDAAAVAKIIEDLEPVFWDKQVLNDLTLGLTPSGKNSLWFSSAKMGVDVERALARLPGFLHMNKIAREKPAVIVLLRARPAESPPAGADDGEPALVTMTYGRGSVVGILGDGLWQWSLLDKDKRDLVGFYDAFWSNLVRWLAMGGDFQPGQQVSLKLGRSSIYLGDSIMIDAVFKLAPESKENPSVIITDSNGKSDSLMLNRVPGRDPRFRAQYTPAVAGVFRVTLNTPSLTPDKQDRGFSVHDVSLERLETSANPMAMSMLAEHTGGEAFRPQDSDRLLDKLQRHMLAAVVPTQPQYVWDNGVLLFILLTWAGLEWIMRRKAGLL